VSAQPPERVRSVINHLGLDAEKVEKYGVADLQIKDVDVSTKWVNLKARVVEKSVSRTVYSRVGGSYTLSAETISDDTGSVQLPL
jgi:hypothetical protein